MNRKQKQIRSIVKKLNANSDKIIATLPKDVNYEAFLGSVTALLEDNDKSQTLLTDCDEASIVSCFMEAASQGFVLSRHASDCYMVPRNGKAKLLIGVHGLVRKVLESGYYKKVQAHLVYENDTLEFDYGTDERVSFKPKVFGDRGELVGTLCTAKQHDNELKFKILENDYIEKVREEARVNNGGKEGPSWEKWTEQMIAKTALRQFCTHELNLLSVVTKEWISNLDDEQHTYIEPEVEEKPLSPVELALQGNTAPRNRIPVSTDQPKIQPHTAVKGSGNFRQYRLVAGDGNATFVSQSKFLETLVHWFGLDAITAESAGFLFEQNIEGILAHPKRMEIFQAHDQAKAGNT